jgi:hypothetical protein
MWYKTSSIKPKFNRETFASMRTRPPVPREVLSFINFAAREINCKIVYYGAGLGGKTTNLQFIYQKTPSSRRAR